MRPMSSSKSLKPASLVGPRISVVANVESSDEGGVKAATADVMTRMEIAAHLSDPKTYRTKKV